MPLKGADRDGVTIVAANKRTTATAATEAKKDLFLTP